MNTKNKDVSEDYRNEKLNIFFTDAIEPESMAKIIRHVNYILALTLMRETETLQIHLKELEDGFYWLNELAEILNPYLDID